MTKTEWATIAAGLKTMYARQNFLADRQTMEMWYGLLHDLPYSELSIAVQKYMLTEKFPPTVADLREICTPPKLEWSEGWEQVTRAIRHYGLFDIKGAMDSLDPLTAEAVRRLGGFRRICESESMAVDRANFRTIFESLAIKHHEQEMLPPGLRTELIESMTKRLTERTEA